MKRSNLIKIASVLLIVAMMLGAVPANAALSTAAPALATDEVVFTGTVPAMAQYTDVEVQFAVYGPDATESNIGAGNLITVASVKAKPGQSYSVPVPFPPSAESGVYTVKESVAGVTTQKTFYFVSVIRKNAFLQAMKAAAGDSGAMKAVLDNYMDVLQMDALYNGMSDAGKEKAAAELAVNPVLASMPTDLSFLSTAINAAGLPGLVQALNENLVKSVSVFQTYLNGLDSATYINAYNSVITDSARSAVIANLSGKNIADLNKLNVLFKEQVVVAGTAHASGLAQVNSILATYGNLPALTNWSVWNKGSDQGKAEVANTIIQQQPTTTAALNAILATTKGETPVVTPGPSNPGSGGPGTSVTVPGQPKPTSSPQDPYIDMSGHWSYDAVMKLTELGVINGYSDKTFQPEGKITREEFVKALTVCIYGADAAKGTNPTYTDAQNGWYSPYLDVAERNGLTEGLGDGTFGVGRQITRQDMATLVYRMMVKQGFSPNTNDVSFGDSSSIADYARPCVNALSNASVVSGYPDGTFLPLNITTRAEAATMIYKACKLINKI